MCSLHNGHFCKVCRIPRQSFVQCVLKSTTQSQSACHTTYLQGSHSSLFRRVRTFYAQIYELRPCSTRRKLRETLRFDWYVFADAPYRNCGRHNPSARLLRSPGCFLLLAGFDTSSSFALYELAKNPTIEHRLQAELRVDLQSSHNHQLSYDTLTGLVYLRQVLEDDPQFHDEISYPPRELQRIASV